MRRASGEAIGLSNVLGVTPMAIDLFEAKAVRELDQLFAWYRSTRGPR
ncbi:hypothetical protein [Micromonospora andamanensis]|nr:hypothetical protein [Micromonospora andamanensis]